ncbi:MAG: hypothetical protein H6819_05520 [Phycisphaerales bacterium]|nr:hypothetical protein [Phycisphaerales bacterium]MCB9854761.1 hypothetical protein [Phycisphaerales bacterium]MCB9863767.1 hypothetical protein [Phycisphaerales bacterium]
MQRIQQIATGRFSTTIGTALCVSALCIAGCDFDAIGNGDGIPAPGLGCSKDLYPASIGIDLTPPVDSILVGGAMPAPTNSEFLEFNHAFAIEWQYAYEGFFTPGPAKHAYRTIVRILRNEEVIWEQSVDSEPVDVGDEGTDYVVVSNGLPIGFYTARIELDPDDEVPECDDLVSVVNNVRELTFNVWGSGGPPQSPTPCEESEDPDCGGDSDGGRRGV